MHLRLFLLLSTSYTFLPTYLSLWRVFVIFLGMAKCVRLPAAITRIVTSLIAVSYKRSHRRCSAPHMLFRLL